MNNIKLATTMAIVFFAIAIALLNTTDWSWHTNVKSYLGIIAAIILFIWGRKKN